MKSTVSVIIPCFNSARFVAEAVNSVLKQTRPPDEIIVVDDGSTDDTADVLNRFKGQISYIRQENRGPSTARNTGIQAATGELICFLDADDIWLPEKLERQLDFITQNLDVGLLFTDEEEIEAASGRVLQPSLLSSRKRFERPNLPGYVSNAVEQLLLENFIPTSTVMTRRSCLKVSGLFDEKLQVSEDRDLWTRLAANFPVAVLPEVLAVKRVHSDNISSNQELT
ncbi:MAG TPA: glycosyltransferase, partial [Acidobacteriota bacterium]|nr:glycosyltransferase [Acidobacteriota bacterium]